MKKLVLISLDEEYMDLLEGSLIFGLSRDVETIFISNQKYLLDYTSRDTKADIVVVDEKCVPSVSRIKTDSLFIITDEIKSEEQFIYKMAGYQAILRALPNEFLRNDSESRLQNTRVIKVASVCGGSGKTTTALGLAHSLYDMGKKVLYINTENFQNFSSLIYSTKKLPDETVRTMTKPATVAVDYLLNDLDNQGFDFIPEIPDILTSCQITLQTYAGIINEICRRKIYDYIVVELPFGVPSKDILVVKQYEHIVLTILQDDYSVKKTSDLIKMLGYKPDQCSVVCGKYDQDKKKFFEDEVGGCVVCEYIDLESDSRKGIFEKTAVAVM